MKSLQLSSIALGLLAGLLLYAFIKFLFFTAIGSVLLCVSIVLAAWALVNRKKTGLKR